MKSRSTAESAIFCTAALIGLALLLYAVHVVSTEDGSNKQVLWLILCGLGGMAIFSGTRYLTVRKRTQAELTSGEQYRELAGEYRRLADLAITAQEHTDLKLGDVSAQLDYLREQNASLQKILKDVE
jgi:hypothetical protein